MNVATLQIRRWRNEIVVAREHREPARARARLDELTGRLALTLASELQTWFADHAEQVVCIRRLHLDCELDLSRASDDLLRRWSRRFARALLDSVAANDSEVMRWPSPAAYRARYIHDVASANATDVWYYREFEGLQALPDAAAIRTLLSEDAAAGRAALALLERSTWTRLALVLTAREADRILEALAGEDTQPFDLDAAAACAHAAQDEVSASTIPAVRALHLFALALRNELAPTRSLMQWLRAVAQATCMAERAGAERVIEALSAADFAACSRLEPGADLQTWSWLARPGWRQAVIEQVHAAALHLCHADDARLHSRLAGMALLLGEIDALLDDTVCQQLPACEAAPARALAGWLVLAYSTGAEQRHAFLRDRLWREWFGLPPAVDSNLCAAWLERHSAEPALAALSRRAARWARGSPLLIPLRGDAERRHVEIDSASGVWLRFVDHHSAAGEAVWRTRLRCARLARADARFLRAPLPLPVDWMRFFEQCAQIALRRFAYRLPRFAASSLPHLRANVFAVPGSWDAATMRMRLARPPLYPLLNLVGITRASIDWNGPPKRALRLELDA